MNLCAVVQTRSNLNFPGRDFVTHLYDKDRPLDVESENECARYGYVDTLGPFRTLAAAASAAQDSIDAGRPIHAD